MKQVPRTQPGDLDRAIDDFSEEIRLDAKSDSAR
jgi:hypothetical protein